MLFFYLGNEIIAIINEKQCKICKTLSETLPISRLNFRSEIILVGTQGQYAAIPKIVIQKAGVKEVIFLLVLFSVPELHVCGSIWQTHAKIDIY